MNTKLSTEQVAQVAFLLGGITANAIQCQQALVAKDWETLAVRLSELSVSRDQIFRLLNSEAR